VEPEVTDAEALCGLLDHPLEQPYQDDGGRTVERCQRGFAEEIQESDHH
jgi:hypothetical protein